MSDVVIRVPAEVRDQLAAVAEARGTSIRALMQEIAAQTLTPEQIMEAGRSHPGTACRAVRPQRDGRGVGGDAAQDA
ncbi:Arc family DNA-binding protein [Streptomyces sp. T028]|uniref:Arc family DNA-binding protein n=1 Tax=Streptomyces sp. T028 TaxID=3394379 RepID=UPI003A8A78C7